MSPVYAWQSASWDSPSEFIKRVYPATAFRTMRQTVYSRRAEPSSRVLQTGPSRVVVGYVADESSRVWPSVAYVLRDRYGKRSAVDTGINPARPLPETVPDPDGSTPLTLNNGLALRYATRVAARLTRRQGKVDRDDIAQLAMTRILGEGAQPDEPIAASRIYIAVKHCAATEYRRKAFTETREVVQDHDGNAVIVGVDTADRIILAADRILDEELPQLRLAAECMADIRNGIDPATGDKLAGERKRLLVRAVDRITE